VKGGKKLEDLRQMSLRAVRDAERFSSPHFLRGSLATWLLRPLGASLGRLKVQQLCRPSMVSMARLTRGQAHQLRMALAEHAKAMWDILCERLSRIGDSDSDPLTRGIESARAVLDDACLPYLRDPSWREWLGSGPMASKINKAMDSSQRG
jgi:hypothetical protein